MRRNTKEGLGPILVICEATGGYERLVLEQAHYLGLDAHRAEGRRTRLFALAHGYRAKTDPLDAKIIARFAQKTDCSLLYELPSPEQKKLTALVGRREDILTMKLGEQRRLKTQDDKDVKKSLRAIIKMLHKQMLDIEKKLSALIKESKNLANKNALLQSLVGVGTVTARTLLATMPELGTLSKGQAAALIGLAPYNRDSGATNQRRHIKAGRFAARRCLFMAATVAINRNPILKKKFQQLTENGKPYKVALVAIMRKMIVILNAILKSQTPWKGIQTT
jgi:transposase